MVSRHSLTIRISWEGRGQTLNITETDLIIAAALYPVLVECARQSPARKLTYGALLDEAKARFPNVDALQSAIPISLGRRLDVVRLFLTEQSLPNLTSLVVSADTGEVGSAFGANPEGNRADVAAFDWSAVTNEFSLHIAHLRKGIATRARPKLQRDAALASMSEYFLSNRGSLPKGIERKREEIIDLIRGGSSPKEAFSRAALSM